MYYPDYRPRRLRKNENFRRMIRETKLSVDDLVYPLLLSLAKTKKKPIHSMPGNFQMSIDHILKESRKRRTWVFRPSSFRDSRQKRRTGLRRLYQDAHHSAGRPPSRTRSLIFW